MLTLARSGNFPIYFGRRPTNKQQNSSSQLQAVISVLRKQNVASTYAFVVFDDVAAHTRQVRPLAAGYGSAGALLVGLEGANCEKKQQKEEDEENCR